MGKLIMQILEWLLNEQYWQAVSLIITIISVKTVLGSEIGWLFFKDMIFYRLLYCCPIEELIKIDFGWPSAENGRKMTNGRLLFLALI